MDLFSQLLSLPGFKGAAQVGGLVFVRLLPIVAFTPVFGGQAMPRRLRTGLAITFTLALLPGFAIYFGQLVTWDRYAALLAKEAVIGLTLAFFVMILFETLAAFGALVDLARGATLANVLDPLTQQQQSIMATFFTQFGIVLFFSIGGHRLLFAAFSESFLILRPFDLMPPHLLGAGATGLITDLIGALFLVAIQLAAPAVVVLFLLDFCLGVINRVAPQIEVFFFSLTIKGSLGLVIILVALGFITDLIVGHFAQSLRLLRLWVQSGAG